MTAGPEEAAAIAGPLHDRRSESTVLVRVGAGGAALVALGVALSILHFGGVTELGTMFLWMFALPGALLLLGARWRAGELAAPTATEWLAVALAAFAWVQVAPLPSALVRAVSGEAAAWAEILDRPARTLSVDAGLTVRSAFFGVLLLLLFLGGREVARWNAVRWALPVAVVALAGYDALYGLFERFARDTPHIWGFERTAFTDCVTGTFINRNHFAALMVVAVPMAIALLWRLLPTPPELAEPAPGGLVDDEPAAVPRGIGRAGIAVAAALVVMVAGVLLSRSRMGTAATAVVVVVALAQMPLMDGWYKRQRVVAVIFSLVVVALFVLLLGGGLGDRFKQLAVGGETARRATWVRTLAMTANAPWTGTGLGTYPAVFQRHAALDNETYAYHAHSDILEFLAEAGAIGFLLVAAIAGTLSARYTALGRARFDVGDAWPLAVACFAALVGMFCSASVDFPLQMPGLAALTCVIAGALSGLCDEAGNPLRRTSSS